MKNSKVLIYFVAAALVIGALYLAGKSFSSDKTATATIPKNTAVGTTTLSSGENSFDFGKISMSKGKVTHQFELKNVGSAPVIVRRIYTSCMCTSATLIRGNNRVGPFSMPGHGFNPGIEEAIAPGEKVALEVVFDPAAHGPAGVGPIERQVRVETDSGFVELGIKTLVTP